MMLIGPYFYARQFSMSGNAFIAHGGGPTAVLNSSLLGVVEAARRGGALPKQERLGAVRMARGERGIWQRRFWEHLIRDEADYARHVEYCYINPLKHGQVAHIG